MLPFLPYSFSVHFSTTQVSVSVTEGGALRFCTAFFFREYEHLHLHLGRIRIHFCMQKEKQVIFLSEKGFEKRELILSLPYLVLALKTHKTFLSLLAAAKGSRQTNGRNNFSIVTAPHHYQF